VLYQAELHPEMDNPVPKRSRGGGKDSGARSVLKAPSRSNANLSDPKHGQRLAVHPDRGAGLDLQFEAPFCTTITPPFMTNTGCSVE
jgi:hypothetical protein